MVNFTSDSPLVSSIQSLLLALLEALLWRPIQTSTKLPSLVQQLQVAKLWKRPLRAISRKCLLNSVGKALISFSSRATWTKVGGRRVSASGPNSCFVQPPTGRRLESATIRVKTAPQDRGFTSRTGKYHLDHLFIVFDIGCQHLRQVRGTFGLQGKGAGIRQWIG